MRLFVAIALPASAAGELDSAVAPLRLAWPELRWTGQDAWHLTLAFLGEVDEKVTRKLTVRLGRAAARHPRLPLSLGGAGAFPGAGRARVLWTGVQGDVAGLSALADSVAAAASRAGAPPASRGRRYEPHLTLARCRAPADVRTLVATLGGFAGTGWTATEIYLIHSRPQGRPRYETLGSWPLLARETRPPGPGRPGQSPVKRGQPGQARRPAH
ncbi:MAG TPA: RNA 2',3'-cyclic phosphodiesterase [Streptosporangiaceae bacterium]|nr:RNA 2',3'-cyclic phosphodiesterase [Streptosporangiaceae bacterium]